MAELCLREEASLPRNVLSVLVGSLTDSVVIMQRLRAFSRKWILSSNRLIKDHLVKAETTTKQKHEDIINGHPANLGDQANSAHGAHQITKDHIKAVFMASSFNIQKYILILHRYFVSLHMFCCTVVIYLQNWKAKFVSQLM